MVGVLNLRGVGGFAPGLWRANLCGVVRWRAELQCASRGAPVPPFLIASGPNIKNGAKSLTAKEKIFSNRYFFGYLRRPALSASTANPAAAGFGHSTRKSRRDAGATNSTAKATSPACPSGKQAAATKSKEGAQPGVAVPRLARDWFRARSGVDDNSRVFGPWATQGLAQS